MFFTSILHIGQSELLLPLVASTNGALREPEQVRSRRRWQVLALRTHVGDHRFVTFGMSEDGDVIASNVS
jgi:hypothetical protein